MKYDFEIYTDSKTVNMKEIKSYIEEVKNNVTGYNFDELARLWLQDDNKNNILIECQIPTKDAIDLWNDKTEEIELVAYEYEGNYEDYSADNEIMRKTFNMDWNTLKEQMLEMAITVIE